MDGQWKKQLRIEGNWIQQILRDEAGPGLRMVQQTKRFLSVGGICQNSPVDLTTGIIEDTRYAVATKYNYI